MSDLEEATNHIAVVFNCIKSAAMMIESVDPNAILESWNRQETTLPFTDPTAAMKVYAARDDMRRKKQIIEAAAKFVNEWNRIKKEALEADKSHAI